LWRNKGESQKGGEKGELELGGETNIIAFILGSSRGFGGGDAQGRGTRTLMHATWKVKKGGEKGKGGG